MNKDNILRHLWLITSYMFISTSTGMAFDSIGIGLAEFGVFLLFHMLFKL